jgi:SAM-dependent methyltransferase
VTAVPDRVRWALEVIDPGPADNLLEIGCGSGVAASLVCARLRTGRMLAVDRSAVAVERTAGRNAEHVAAGRLAVRRSDLHTLDVPVAGFDTAYAIDVNVFWTRQPGPELTVLARALRPGGRLFLLYGSGGPTPADRVTAAVATALRQEGFVDVTVLAEDGGFGVSARTP